MHRDRSGSSRLVRGRVDLEVLPDEGYEEILLHELKRISVMVGGYLGQVEAGDVSICLEQALDQLNAASAILQGAAGRDAGDGEAK